LSLAPEVEDESDEETDPIEELEEEEEEEEEKENIPPAPAWVDGTHTIAPPQFTEQCASNLPRHREETELGYLRCFLSDTLIDIITANTNLYAKSKQAPAGWATTSAEVWMFIAVHIFMGVCELPNLHMYWEKGWQQEYVMQAFRRSRFKELLRYFHIAEPTPSGQRKSVEDKIKPLWDHCLTVFPNYFTPPQSLTMDESMVRFKGRSQFKTTITAYPY